MPKPILMPVIALLLGLGLIACQSDSDVSESPDEVAQATATERPTETPLPTATFTPTPTPRPTNTPTPAPTSTPTPVIESEARPAGLTLDELPPDFVALPLEDFGLSEDMTLGGNFTLEDPVAFANPNSGQLLVSFTLPVDTALERAGFDLALSQPNLIIDTFAGNLGDSVEITSQETLAGFDDIGDASTGLNMAFVVDGQSLEADIVVFRQGDTGVFLASIYAAEATPDYTIEQALSALLD